MARLSDNQGIYCVGSIEEQENECWGPITDAILQKIKANNLRFSIFTAHGNSFLYVYCSEEEIKEIALSFGEGVCAYREVEETPQDQLYKLHHPIRSFFMKITKRKDS
jgi:hypothetical protein